MRVNIIYCKINKAVSDVTKFLVSTAHIHLTCNTNIYQIKTTVCIHKCIPYKNERSIYFLLIRMKDPYW